MKSALFVLFFSSILFGCKEVEEKGKSVSVKIEVKNSSTKNLRVLLFFPNNSLFKDLNINSLDSIIVEEGFLHPAPDGPSYYLTNGVDSAEIIFSDGRKLIQTFYERGNNDTVNNILQDLRYKYFESFNPDFTRKQFTITEDDYNRAK
jgi:hypothetical protein